MPNVVVIAQVEDSVKWDAGFRTHSELFRSETVSKPIHFATTTGNEVACCFEPADVDTFLKGMDSPETAKAMTFDGVKRETVKVFVVNKEFKV